MGVGAGLYMCDVVVKSSRSLSHLLMSSCVSMVNRVQTSCAPFMPLCVLRRFYRRTGGDNTAALRRERLTSLLVAQNGDHVTQ